MEDEEKVYTRIIVYGNYIAEQNIEQQVNYYGEEKKKGQSHPDDPAGFNNVTLKGFISAGLLTEGLMPAERLSCGEKAMLAHTIADRMEMDAFWPFFQRRWGVKNMAVAHSKYINTKDSSRFKMLLDGIK